MRKLILILIIAFISLSFYSIQKQTENNKTDKPTIDNGFSINDNYYNLHFSVENKANQKPTLVIVIELKKEAHYISPFAKLDFTGKFFMDLGSYKDVDFKSEIIETPRSEETYNNAGQPVNWIHINTTYRQELNIKTLQDFEVFGRVIFTIEPRCTLETIPFLISFKDGKYEVSSPKC
jgi:hypothetical protein